jgi:tRNA(Ile)-lysidine synthase
MQEHPLLEALKTELEALDVRDARIVVGVSGGADSVALLTALALVGPALHLELVAAHANHGLRGAESDADQQFVEELCGRLGVLCVAERLQWTPHPESRHETLEEQARRCRYEFLARVARQHQARFVSTAHTADDQAETVLWRLIRGTGISGLIGIAVRRPLDEHIILVRPLLHQTRDAVRRWLHDIGQPYREDSSNVDLRFTRNRLRHQIIPLLQELNPRVTEALCRLSSVAAELMAILEPLLLELAQRAVLFETEGRLVLSVPALERAPGLLIRELLRKLWRDQRWPQQPMGYSEWDRLAALIHQPTGALDLPGGIRARRRSGTLILERRTDEHTGDSPTTSAGTEEAV